MYTDSGMIEQPDQYLSEFSALLNIYTELAPLRVLEIGVRRGGTFLQWIKYAAPGALIIGVDLPVGKWGATEPVDYLGIWKYASGAQAEIQVVLGNSHSDITKSMIAAAMPVVDFLFIDGDHAYQGVQEDYEYYGALVRPGGVIAMHDILPDATDSAIEVYKYWHEIKRDGDIELTSAEGQKTRGIGVITKCS
jgi:hypothetical protein